jgi:hypothetical protein
MRAGHGSIGKVQVECRFLFTKSQWGVMGEARNPAGIIYLDLDFSQPADCKLESATITVTLTEDDGEEARIHHRSPCHTKFTDHFGPKSVRGPESLVQTRKVKNRTPEVQVLGYGAGGIGINKEKLVQTRGRWDFSGYITSTKDSLWYNILRWELKENSLEWQPTHSNLFHTAFALEHNATRFYMTVHVSGKLAKFSHKIKDIKNRLKFGEKGGKDQEIVTKIEWADGYSCPRRLDPYAQHLHEAMGYANMENVAVEIPGAMAASYHPAITNHSPATAPPPQPLINPPQQPAHQPPLPIPRPWLEPRPPPPTISGEQPLAGNPMQYLPILTLEQLSMASAGFANGPPSRPPPLSTTNNTPAATEADEAELSSSSVTLVNSAVTTQADAEGGHERPADGWQKDTGMDSGEESDSKGQGNAMWLGVTAILLHWFGRMGVLLWGLAGVVGLPSSTMTTTTTKSGMSKAERRDRNKNKSVGFDGASETSSRVRIAGTRPVYPVRNRLRPRRAQRPYLTVDVGGRKGMKGWRDDTLPSPSRAGDGELVG